jgi:hypothetical protein
MKTTTLSSALVFVIGLTAFSNSFAQVKIGANPTTITPNANLEVEADNGDKTVIQKDNGNVGVGTTSPGSKLTVNGSFGASYREETATTASIGPNDYYVVWNGSASGNLTLPAAISGTGNYKGRLYFIKNTTASNNLTVAANGGELIDGAASISVPPGYGVNVVNTGAASGTTWEVISFSNSTGIPQFRTTSAIAAAGSATMTGTTTIPQLMPGMTMNVNNPTGQTLNYLINCNIAYDAGNAVRLGAANMYIHIYPVLFVDHIETPFKTFIEAEPVDGLDNASSNFIGSLNGTVPLGPGDHLIEVGYRVGAFANLASYQFNQAGSVITATTIY